MLLAAALAGALHMHGCVEGKTKVSAECGSLRVYENSATHRGPTIPIHFIVLKAMHPNGKVIYVNLGGPGSELSEVPFIADGLEMKEIRALHDRYDVLFLDERGFGKSHAIPCNLAPLAQPDVYFLKLWPSSLLRACRQKEAALSDLSQYNTLSAARDLDDVRAALRYKKLIFDVDSYGTFTALVYMRLYPHNAAVAVLQGVAPPGIMNEAREFAYGAKISLDHLVAECSADRLCAARFPHFREQFDAAIQRFARGPIPVKVRNQAYKARRVQTVRLSREVFVDAIRHMLYEPESAAYLPLLVQQLSHGHTLMLGNTIKLVTQGFAQGIDGGAFLSYTCAEVMPFTNNPGDLAYARTTWYGTDRTLAQQAACKIWNVPALPKRFDTPVRSDVPVLMVNGTDDPATPAYEAQAQLKYLRNGHLMLVRGAPHDAESPCVDAAIEKFIRAESATGIKMNACGAHFKRPPFGTKLPPFLL